MKKELGIFLVICGSRAFLSAQTPSCPDPYVYMDGGSLIEYYDPSQPLSAANPGTLNIPTFGNGLTLMPSINGGTLSPTFYTTSGGTYWYWTGTSWANTGHTTGSTFAANMAGCGGTIYNIVGSTGQIYTYNGTGNGSLLTTISSFNGGGPYDLVTDCNCNFYVLNTTSPNQGLSMYNSSGVLQCTYPLIGMPSISAGGGFAIIGNMIYVKNSGFYVGTIASSGVTFTAATGFTNTPGDFASCPVCYSLNNSTISGGGVIGCTNPTTNLVVTTNISSVTYFWSGPGIVGANNSSVIVVNAPGTYSCLISAGGCPPTQTTLVTSVTSNSTTVFASITPSGNICSQGTAPTQLVAAYNTPTSIVNWTGSNMPPVTGTDTLSVTAPGSYTVTVTDVSSGCADTDVVTVMQSPSVGLTVSDNTLCLQNYNGSPAVVTITPSGAPNYTLLTSTNFSTSSPNGPTMPCFAVTLTGNLSPLATATLIGANAFCSDTATTSFSIIPNPSLTLSQTSASICPGGSQAFSASGALLYLWGGPGLNTNSGNSVIASPGVSSTYVIVGSDNGCQSSTNTVSVTILPVPTVSVNPANSIICLGSSITLTASGTATSYTWSPLPVSGPTGSTASVVPSGTQIYTVTGSLNSCTNSATAQVNTVQPPVISLGLSSNSMCAYNYNNSPNSISMYPFGASSYTLSAGNLASISSPNGPVMQVTPATPQLVIPTVVTATLSGKSGVCTVATTKTFVIMPNPVLSVSPPSSSICPGQSQTYTVSGASAYSWLPAPGYTLVSANSIVASPSLTSFYSVIGHDAGCYSAVKNAVVVLFPTPNVIVSPNTTTVCAGGIVGLSALGNGNFYTWYPPSSLSTPYGINVFAHPSSTQAYTVVAALNTCTSQAVGIVSVIPMPAIIASSSQSIICSAASTTLYASGANTFQWSPKENLNVSSGNVIIASPHASTTYTVHGYNGICTGSTSLLVQTVKRPNMILTSPGNQICYGSSVPIAVSGAENYTWAPLSGLIPAGSNTLVHAAPLVSTNYSVFGSNSIGSVSCHQQLSYSVIVIPVIKPTVSNSASICLGEKTTLYASGGNTFRWMPSYGLNITNGSGVVASPTVSTVYTVAVSQNSYCTVSTTVSITVNPRPKVFAGRDTVYNLNEPAYVSASGTGTLTWVSGEGIVCPICPETQVYPTRPGCYMAEARNEFGCTVTDVVCVELTEDFSAYIPNAFTPNNDGINDVFMIFGENISQVSMEVYNRWGHNIFSSNDYRTGWDGKYKGVLCEEGAYTYIIHYTGVNRKRYSKTGHIILTR